MSKEGLNIEGISEQTIWKLVNEGLISEYADFYHLGEHAYEIAAWEGFGKKSVTNMLESIRKSRQTDGRHLLYALNIPLCGGDVAKKLIERYPVKELIEKENVETPQYVTVTINDEFVESGAFETTEVKDGDEIEFLYFMGGGAR